MHTLHSRDTWLKQARVVRLGEVPYKVTTAGALQAEAWALRAAEGAWGEASRADFSGLRKTGGSEKHSNMSYSNGEFVRWIFQSKQDM